MPVESDYCISKSEIEGEIPRELKGTLFKVGPALFERGGVKVKHPFDGDGAVHSLKIENGEVRYRSKFVRTEGFLREEESGKFMSRGAYATPKPAPKILGISLPEFVSNAFDFNFKNTSNITTIPWGGKLLVGWNGLPYALDLETLETEGVDNLSDSFQPGDLVQAHFCVDNDKDRIVMFAVDTSNTSEYLVKFFEFDRNFSLVRKRSEKLPIQGGVPLLHDFALTENYILMFQSPLQIKLMQFVFGFKALNECIEFDAEKQSCPLLVIPRNTDLPMRVLDAPNNWTWHMISADEKDKSGSGKEVVNIFAFSSPKYHFKYDFTGKSGEDYVFPRLTKYTVNLGDGASVEQKKLCTRNMEMPDCARERIDVNYAYALTTGKDEGFAPLQNLCKLDLKADGESDNPILDIWKTGTDYEFLSEPTFVSRNSGVEEDEDDGWVLTLRHDTLNERASLLIFDAKDIGKGPIASVPIKTWVPWIFHGAFHGA